MDERLDSQTELITREKLINEQVDKFLNSNDQGEEATKFLVANPRELGWFFEKVIEGREPNVAAFELSKIGRKLVEIATQEKQKK